MSPMEKGPAHFEVGSESPSRVKAELNCQLQMSAFSFASALRIPFSPSDVNKCKSKTEASVSMVFVLLK